jgi:hypothetical protein
MELGKIELPVYQAEAITPDYLVRGEFQPVGPMLPYLRDAGRRYVPFKETTVAAFEAGNPLTKLQPSVVMLNKDEIVALNVLDQAGLEAAQLLATKHKMILYTRRFVLRGYLHMGVEDLPLDVLSSSNFDYMGMTETVIYPLKSSGRSPQPGAPLTLINRKRVIFYHPAED